MAKYTVKFSCGHEEVVELFGKSADRERKIKYYEEHCVCKECWKKENGKDELVLNVISQKDYDVLYFSGNTYEHKDEIKSIGGYRWADLNSYIIENAIENNIDHKDTFSALKYFGSKTEMYWIKKVKKEDTENEIALAEKLQVKKIIRK